MIKKAFVIFCAAGFFTGAGCVTLKIEPHPEPEQLVETFVLCRSVIPDGELLAPSDISTDFIMGGPDVFCFVGLKHVGRFMTLKWKWYAPGGQLFRETADVPVNANEAYLETVTAYDRLDLQQVVSFEGLWVVVILVNGELVGRRTFIIR